MNRYKQVVWDGAVAGILGGLTVALWFLIFDLSRGAPLETPALLARVFFHGGSDHASLLRLAGQYSALHFAAFLLFGVMGAILLQAAENEPSLVPALALMLAAFEVLFIALVIVMGPQLQAALSWWSVLVGNLLATAVMLGYFFSRHSLLAWRLFGPWVGVVAEGAIAGLIGGTVVAGWFFLSDLGAGDLFRTPALLGAAILQGSLAPDAAAVSAPIVLGYTGLHFAVFIAFGVAAACLMAAAEREPILLLGLMLLFACFEGFFLGFAALLSHALLDQLGWLTIAVGNLLAAGAMLGFFYWRHRELHLRLADHWSNQHTR